MKSTFNPALRQRIRERGVDAEKINTGVAASARRTIETLIETAETGAQSADVIAAAAEKAAEGWDDAEIRAFREALLGALEAGRISGDQYLELKASIANLRGEADEAAGAFKDMGEQIQLAASLHELQNLTAEVMELYEAGELTEQQFRELQKAIAEGRAGEKGHQAGQDTADSFNQAGQAANQTARAVESVGESAEESGTAAKAMGAQIASVLADVRSISKGAAEEVDRLVRDLNGVSLPSAYFEKLFEGLGRIQREYDKQVETFREIEDRLNAGAEAAEVYNQAVLAATNATQLLDQARLDRLNQIIAEARRQIEAARQETLDWIDDTKRAAEDAWRRVRELRGEREQLEIEDQEATIRDLEKRIREAGTLGSEVPPEVLESLKDRLAAEKEILSVLREQAKESKQERREEARAGRSSQTRTSGVSQGRQTAQDGSSEVPAGLPPPGESFTVFLNVDGQTFPGQFSPDDARALLAAVAVPPAPGGGTVSATSVVGPDVGGSHARLAARRTTPASSVSVMHHPTSAGRLAGRIAGVSAESSGPFATSAPRRGAGGRPRA